MWLCHWRSGVRSHYLGGDGVTTIAFDGQIMAADTQGTSDDGVIEQHNYRKLYECTDHIIGMAGDFGQQQRFLEWLTDCGPMPVFSEMDRFSALVYCRKDQSIHYYDRQLKKIEVGAKTAIGTGGKFALGAMLAGKNAIEAVDIAKKLDVWSGGETISVVCKPTV